MRPRRPSLPSVVVRRSAPSAVRRRRAALAAGMALLGLVGSASPSLAATVSMKRSDAEMGGAPVVFKAARGETNRVSLTATRKTVVVRDAGATLRARGRCKALDAHRVRCANDHVRAELSLGDRSDRLALKRTEAEVTGGPGNDRLTASAGKALTAVTFDGGPGDDRLTGGRDDDVLRPGPGRDVVRAGGGTDTIVDGEDGDQAKDVYDGGSNPGGVGRGDTIDYAASDGAVTLDLAAGTSSTDDSLTGFEGAIGGSGDDAIVGTAVTDTIDGGAGSDRVAGGGGDDELTGGAGDDLLAGQDGNDTITDDAGTDAVSGGAGDDKLDVRDTGADGLDCGDGLDTVYTDLADTLTAACERADGPAGPVSVVPAVDADSADFAVHCDSADDGETCRGTITLTRTDQTPFGTAAYSVPLDADGVASVPLTPADRAQLAQGVGLVVDLGRVRDAPVGYRIQLQG